MRRIEISKLVEVITRHANVMTPFNSRISIIDQAAAVCGKDGYLHGVMLGWLDFIFRIFMQFSLDLIG